MTLDVVVWLFTISTCTKDQESRLGPLDASVIITSISWQRPSLQLHPDQGWSPDAQRTSVPLSGFRLTLLDMGCVNVHSGIE